MSQTTQYTPPAYARVIDVTGVPDDVVRAIESLVAAVRGPTTEQPLHSAPYEVWVKEFDAWVKSHPKRDTLADDSRESIYAGRGE